MGVSFCVVFRKKVPPYGTLGGDNMALARGYERLDKAAAARGLPTLEQFVSQDPDEMADLLDMDPEEMGLPPIQWFPPAEGLATVRALASFLREDPKAVSQGVVLLEELGRVEAELAAAVGRKSEFRFALVP